MRSVAAALNCESAQEPTTEPCGTCEVCRDIAAGKFKNAAKLCELEARVEKDTDRRIALYRELARSGVGMIVV